MRVQVQYIDKNGDHKIRIGIIVKIEYKTFAYHTVQLNEYQSLAFPNISGIGRQANATERRRWWMKHTGTYPGVPHIMWH